MEEWFTVKQWQPVPDATMRRTFAVQSIRNRSIRHLGRIK